MRAIKANVGRRPAGSATSGKTGSVALSNNFPKMLRVALAIVLVCGLFPFSWEFISQSALAAEQNGTEFADVNDVTETTQQGESNLGGGSANSDEEQVDSDGAASGDEGAGQEEASDEGTIDDGDVAAGDQADQDFDADGDAEGIATEEAVDQDADRAAAEVGGLEVSTESADEDATALLPGSISDEQCDTLTYEDDNLVATVKAAQGVLPEGATLEVEEIHPVTAEKADAYGEALSALSDTLYKEDKVYTAAKVYDIRILDADGTEMEPAGQVAVTLDYKKAQPMGKKADPVEVAHVTDEGDLERMDAEVETDKSGAVEIATFEATSFSYYLVFSSDGNATGGTTEASVGDGVGWLKMNTPAGGTWTDASGNVHNYDRWGIGTSVAELISNDGRSTEEINQVGSNVSRRIVQIRLLKEDGTEYKPGKTTYFWTWEQNIRVEDFNLPGLEVTKTVFHTAHAGEGVTTEQDSLIGSYTVRGYTGGGHTDDEVNTLDIYVKAETIEKDSLRYIIRYVHADGSITDGNVKYINKSATEQSVSYTLDDDSIRRDGEVYSGVSVVAGSDAVSFDAGKTQVTFTYTDKVNLAKVYVYFEEAQEDNTTQEKDRYDKNADGKYYNNEVGLYTDKSAEKVDDREFLVNLEAWYVDTAASVGMVLDSSGSMAWTAGVPTVLNLEDLVDDGTMTQAQFDDLVNNYSGSAGTGWPSTTIPLSKLTGYGVLVPTETDNSNLSYNDYKYYVYTKTTYPMPTPFNPINEYVALGYTDGNTSGTVTGSGGGTTKLGNNGVYTGTAMVTNWSSTVSERAGWYYVNSGTIATNVSNYGGKVYEGLRHNGQTGACKFWVVEEDGKHHLYCRFNSGNATESASQSAPVCIKRDQMFTKAETLQDALSQFGAILNAAAPDSQIAVTRYSHMNFNGTNVVLMGWSNESEDLASVLNTKGTGGDNNPDTGKKQYVITGGTVARMGLESFKNNLAGASNGQNTDNDKYLIIFTDGKDQGGEGSRPQTTEAWLNTNFPGYQIITVFMKSTGMDTSDMNASETQLRAWATQDENGNDLYFDALSSDSYEMVQKFREIAEYITTGLHNYSVRDYIDPRFDVVNENRQVLSVLDEDGNFTSTDTMNVDANGHVGFTTPDGKYAQLGYDSQKKMFYVLWQNQDIQGSSIKGDTVFPWQSQIRLQAKKDFIGGNDVLTNGNEPTDNLVYKPQVQTNSDGTTKLDESGKPVPVYGEDGLEVQNTTEISKSFPFASVNPGLLDVALSNYEDTIFLGETITPGELLSNMARTGTPSSRIVSDETADRRVADSVYNSSAMTAAGDTDQSSIWYVEYLERLGKKLHGDTEYYFTLLKHVDLTGTSGVAALITAAKNDGNYTVTEGTGTVTIEGKANTKAAGEKIEIDKTSKITLTLPYYYLESPTDPSSYAGLSQYAYTDNTSTSRAATGTTETQEDCVGTLTYTWEVKDFAGNKVFADSKSEGNKFVQFDTYVDSSHHMTTGDPKKDVTASVQYQFSIAYVPAALTSDATSDGSGSTDAQGDGSERTRALIGKTDSTADRVASLVRNVASASEVSAVNGKQNTTDEMGWAVIHAVDGRILVEKKMKTSDLALVDSLKLSGSMTFTLTGNGIALNDDGTAKDEVVWTGTIADVRTATRGAVDGGYTYLTIEDNWAEGLPQGTYTLTETTTGAVEYVTIAAEDVEFDTSASTDPAGPYDATVTNWAAANTGTVTYYIGTVNSGTPSTTSYEDTDYAYAKVVTDLTDGTTTYKQIDPALNESDGKAYLNSQLGHAVVENTLVPTAINVTKTWEDADCIPTEGIVIKITGSDGSVYYVPLAATTDQTWSGTTGAIIPLSSATYTAEEGTGTCTQNADGTYSCLGFKAFGDTFTLNTSDGKKQFSKTNEVYTDQPNADNETATDAVTANTAPLAGTIAFTNAKIKTSVMLTKVDAQAYAAAVAKAQEDLDSYNASKTDDAPEKTLADFLTLGNTELLEGVTFQLKKSDGTVVDTATTDATGKITFTNLQMSTDYIISETSAPAGWTMREDILLTVNANGTVVLGNTYSANDSMAPTLGTPDDTLAYPLTVPNARTYMLPAAGGLGVYPFLLIGAFVAAYALSGAKDERRRNWGRKASRRAAGPMGGD